MNIALTASTGKVGTAILTAARERKLPIRALVRNPARLSVPVSETVPFDFADRTTHARALTGVDTLILISPSSANQIEADGAVIDAARAAGVTHIIRLSGAGAEHGGGRFADQHRAIDRYLGASGVAATIVRPTFFMENLLGLTGPVAAGMYPAPMADAALGRIAVADIAAVLFTVAAAPAAHRGATYALTGPAAYRGEEIAAALSQAAGHPVRYVDVPEQAYRENLLRVGLDAWTADGLVEAYRLVRSGGTAAVTDDVHRETGRAPISLAAWARAKGEAFQTHANA